MGCRPGRRDVQPEPVLAGVDLDPLSPTREGVGAARVRVRGCRSAGVAEVFPHAEQRDDHVLYEMNKVRSAYAAIEGEGEALGRLGKIRARDKTCRRKAKCALSAPGHRTIRRLRGGVDTLRAPNASMLPAASCTAPSVMRRRRRAFSLRTAPRAGSGARNYVSMPRAVVDAGGARACAGTLRASDLPTPGALSRHLLADARCKTGSAQSASLLDAVEAVLHQRHVHRAPSRGSMRRRPYLYPQGRHPRSTCSAPGSICAPGGGGDTRGPAPTRA